MHGNNFTGMMNIKTQILGLMFVEFCLNSSTITNKDNFTTPLLAGGNSSGNFSGG